MKIDRNLPIRGKQTQKTSASRTDGAFRALFDAEITALPAVGQPASGDHPDAKQTWKALQDSVSLLDQAMQCLETGDAPSNELVDSIEQLRAAIKQQLGSNSSNQELSQAEVMLSVEIERIRALKTQ